MANYSLVINSRFRPFEYQELLAPVLMATQAHQALEEAYGDLDTEAAVWDRRTEGSEKAHALYTNFSEDLASAAEALSKYGLTPQSRRTMLGMKRRYASDITPIAEAWTKRQADIKAQQEAMLRDPYHAFNRVAADTSLDTYLDNPNIDVLSENASGAVLAAQVRAMAGDIKNYIDNRNISKLEKLGLPYQYIQKIIHGATADQVLKTMQGDPEAAPFLHNIVETVMKGSGVRDWSSMNGDWVNNPIYKRLESQAMTGLTAAIGTTELKNYTDSFSMQDALNARQHARAKEPKEPKKLAINPLNIYSSRELKANEKKYKDNIKNYSDYFYKDAQGRTRLTVKGLNEYRRKIYAPTTTSGPVIPNTRKSVYIETPFKKFLDSIGGSMSAEEGAGWNSARIGELWEKYVKNSPEAKTATYDATKATEFNYTYDESEQQNIKDAIATANRGTSLDEVDFDNKSKTFTNTGKELTMEKLNDGKYKVIATRFSPFGTTVLINDGKDVRRYRMVSGINTSNENFRDAAMKDAYDIQERLKNSKLSAADRAALEEEYSNAVQEAYLHHSQIGGRNKTREQEFNLYGF